jgi:CRISPR-associated protein (TIGR03986 family)
MTPRHSSNIRPRVDRKGQSFSAVAPYNFVPLPDKMVPAPALTGQDRYESDPATGHHVTGWIHVKLEVCSPLYVRGMLTEEQYASLGGKGVDQFTAEQKAELAAHYATPGPGGQLIPALPGSSLRGMLREMVEIISYGRVRWVAPRPTFTFRAVAASSDDPLREPYQEALGRFGSKVRAGYLMRREGHWWVQPAKTPEGIGLGGTQDKAYLKVSENRIESRNITDFVRFDSPNYVPRFFPVSFEAQVLKGKRGPFVGITAIGDETAGHRHRGVLVCSGNMLETSKPDQQSPRTKHALVLEPDMKVKPLRINAQAVRDYRNGLTPFQQELTHWRGKEWGCLKAGAPVFYVAEADEVVYFGHSPNFRVPMRLFGSERAAHPLDFVPRELWNDKRPDFADAIFGWVEEKVGDELAGPPEQRAGRVFISDALLTSPVENAWLMTDCQVLAPHTLGTPKPTTFQHYLVQDATAGHDPNQKATLAHYGTRPTDTQIRGHKLYWHKDQSPDIRASDKELGHEKQLTRICPIKPGACFEFDIRFENLADTELGALLWALTLPGQPSTEYRHKLGMGKPLGMGAVKLSPQLWITDRQARYTTLMANGNWFTGASEARSETYQAGFEDYVLKQLGPAASNKRRLADLERIGALLTLLSWPGPHPTLTRYMQIERGVNRRAGGKEETVNEYKERPVLPGPEEVAPHQVRSDPSSKQSDTVQ